MLATDSELGKEKLIISKFCEGFLHPIGYYLSSLSDRKINREVAEYFKVVLRACLAFCDGRGFHGERARLSRGDSRYAV